MTTDAELAVSLQRQLTICAQAILDLGHTVVTEDNVITEVVTNRIASTLVANISDGVTTLVNKGPHDIVVTDPTGTSTHRAKPGDPVAIYKAP